MLGKPQGAVWLHCLPCCLACLFQITNQLVTTVIHPTWKMLLGLEALLSGAEDYNRQRFAYS